MMADSLQVKLIHFRCLVCSLHVASSFLASSNCKNLQADRSFIMRKEKEILLKTESVETARKMVDNSQSRIEELEYQLQKAIAEKNEVEIKVEEAMQDSG